MTRDDIESLLWQWSHWQAEQRAVDEVLAAVDEYAAGGTALRATRQETERILTEAREEAERIIAAAVPVFVAPEPEPEPPSCPLLTGGVDIVQRGNVFRVQQAETDRTCTVCGTTQSIERFNRDKNSRSGRKAQCKGCEAEQRKQRRARKQRQDFRGMVT